jgi:hypothetical protein
MIRGNLIYFGQGEVVMGASDSDASVALKQCQYLWKEFKYRHDLIWQRIFRFTTAVVLISMIPYVQRDIARLLGAGILIAPVLATILAVFVLVVMWNELKLFRKITTAYWRQQNELLDQDLQHNLSAKRPFDCYVKLYLGSLVVLSIVNGLLVWLIWIPKAVRAD